MLSDRRTTGCEACRHQLSSGWRKVELVRHTVTETLTATDNRASVAVAERETY
jgi:hypothetical protein